LDGKYNRGWFVERGLLVRRVCSLALLCVLVFAAACSDTPTRSANNADFSQTDVRVGTGDTAATGDILTVNYTGWFFDADSPEQKGPQFDSSTGRQPLVFTLGVGQVIAGWDVGLVGMKAGGLRRLVIPPSLAYGRLRNGIVPPNATLVFDIELVEVQ
jgi:FKBP-type peptidyl-prolyl cis-trans isomerase FkpA